MGCPICSWTSANMDFLLLGETPVWRLCLAPNQSRPDRFFRPASANVTGNVEAGKLGSRQSKPVRSFGVLCRVKQSPRWPGDCRAAKEPRLAVTPTILRKPYLPCKGAS